MAEEILVVHGGKLIDGTGRPPIDNSTILIQGRKFTAVGASGDLAVPAGAQVIDVKGKTVLPGFIDGHGHLEDFHGELYLHLGITTCANIELYQDGPWTLAQKQGTDLGKIRGPRIWMSGRAIGGVGTGHDAFGSRTFRDNIIVTTAENAAVRDADRVIEGPTPVDKPVHRAARLGQAPPGTPPSWPSRRMTWSAPAPRAGGSMRDCAPGQG